MSHPLCRFNRSTVKALNARGIRVLGATWVPGADGTYANGETAYNLDDNGTGRVRSFLEVLALAAAVRDL